MEHSRTSRNVPEHRIIMIIMRNYKSRNVAMLKLHKCYNLWRYDKMQLKFLLWLNDRYPVKVLKSLNDWQSHNLLKFMESKELPSDSEELYRSSWEIFSTCEWGLFWSPVLYSDDRLLLRALLYAVASILPCLLLFIAYLFVLWSEATNV